MRGVRRLVRLGIVGVVVSFGVDRVVPITVGLMTLVSFIVTVGVVNVLDRVLRGKKLVACVCARATEILTVGWSARRSLEGIGRCPVGA